MQQPPIDDDDRDDDHHHHHHDDADATEGICLSMSSFSRIISMGTQHRRRAPQRSKSSANIPPPKQQQRCWSCCWWVASLSGFSFGCCCCYFVFGFFPPFIILAIFTSGTNTLLFVLGVLCFLSASWREGHPRSKMNLQTVSTWYEYTLYWVCF